AGTWSAGMYGAARQWQQKRTHSTVRDLRRLAPRGGVGGTAPTRCALSHIRESGGNPRLRSLAPCRLIATHAGQSDAGEGPVYHCRTEAPLLIAFVDLTRFAAQSERVTDAELAEVVDDYYEQVAREIGRASCRDRAWVRAA